MKLPKISYSIMSSLTPILDAKQASGWGLDMIHYDIPPLRCEGLDTIRQSTHLPLDVHLSWDTPLDFLSQIQLKSNC